MLLQLRILCFLLKYIFSYPSQSIMTKKKFSYYAVRKGYNPGIYQSWEECNNQVSRFPNNEYKGFSKLVEAEEYFNSPGSWSCGRGSSADANLLEKNNNQQFSDPVCTVESISLKKSSCGNSVYKLEFAGTSEGNPGKSGAGIVLQRPDDSVAYEVMVGLGAMVKVLAEFHALIFGLRAALDRGIYHIQVSGQFTLINGLQEYLYDKDVLDLEKEANALINTFKLFLVKYEANVCITASSLANKAVGLPDGSVKKIIVK